MAYLLSLLGTVRYYKTSVSEKWLRRFELIHDFSDIDHWQNTINQVFCEIKQSNLNFQIPSFKMEGLDMSRLKFQHGLIEHEQIIQFLELVITDDLASNKAIIPFAGRELVARTSWNKKCESLALRYLDLNCLLDILHLKFLFLRKIIKNSLTIFSPKISKTQKFNQVVTGVSAHEINSDLSYLDFSWLTRLNILKTEETLYVVPRKLEPHEGHPGIEYITEAQLFQFLNYRERIELTAKAFNALFFTKWAFSFETSFHHNAFYDVFLWQKLIDRLQLKKTFISLSKGWPINSEVEVFNQKGLESVLWFYGTGEFYYAEHSPNYKDENIRFSLPLASKVLVWNEHVKKLLIARKLDLNFELNNMLSSQFFVVGPILNSSPKYLDISQKETLRKSYNIPAQKFLIALFDITPMKERYRIKFGVGPYTSFKIQEEFYKSLLKLLIKNENLVFIIKPKREGKEMFEIPPSFLKIQDMKDRVILLKNQISPYLPIRMSDLVLTTPISSPSLLAHDIGIPSFYYDPSNLCCNFSEYFPQELLLKSESKLEKFIEELQKTDWKLTPKWSSQKIIENLKQIIG
jgi:polysaccharide biosynthesis PFTS motif protein